MTRIASGIPGSLIAKARDKWKMTQDELAELWDMQRTHLSRLENSESLTQAWQLLARVLQKHGPKVFK